jgi:hypothetical protein
MNKNYRFMFLRTSYEPLKKSTPLGCVAIALTDNKNRVTYQVSVCNPSDDFNRSQARQLALGRLIEKPKTAIIGVVSPTMHDITRAVMLAVEKDSDVPSRARKAASTWLDAVLSYDFFGLTDRPGENRSYDVLADD